MRVREFVRRHPYLLLVLAVSVAVACLLWIFFVVGRPLPPRHIVMSTGPDGGAFREYGEKYRAALAKDGVDLKLVPSLGNVENLRRLEGPRLGRRAPASSRGASRPRRTRRTSSPSGRSRTTPCGSSAAGCPSPSR